MKKTLRMIRRVFLIVLLTFIVGFVLVYKTIQLQGPKDSIVLNVGASTTPHKIILESLVDDMEKEGYTLQITEMPDVATANSALVKGSLDANYIQHRVSLSTFNSTTGENLVEVASVHIEPFGLYSKQTKSIKDIKSNTEIIVPNSPANQGRALKLLEENGILTFKKGTKVVELTIATYKEALASNPYNLRFKEIDPSLLTGAYNGNDKPFVFINANYALQAGLSPKHDAIISENVKQSQPYVNILVSKSKDKKDKGIQLLSKYLEEKETAQFIDTEFKHEIIAVHLKDKK